MPLPIAPSRRAILATGLAKGVAIAAPGAFAADDNLRVKEAARHRIDIQKRGTGIVVGIRRGAVRSFVSYGRGFIDGAAVGPTSVFPIASLSKIFTALLLADAAQRGKLSLDDPLSRHLPADVHVPTFEGRAITLADLASHSGGLPRRPPNLVSKDPEDPYAGYDGKALLAGISATQLVRAPGSAFEYSNFGYGLLGAALEHRLGGSYAELVSATITGPMGLTHTSLTPPAARDPRRVQGYDLDGNPAPAWDMSALPAAGGLFSTVPDLLTFLDLWLKPGRSPLAAAATTMLQLDRPGDDAKTRMALGWRVEPTADRTLVWSNGSVGGFRTYLAFCAKTGDGVAGFNNVQTPIGIDDIGRNVLDPALPVDMTVPTEHHAISLPPEALGRFVGRYEAAPDDVVLVRLEGGKLFVQVGPQSVPITPEGPTRFFMRAYELQIAFELDTAGAPKVLVWTQNGETFRYLRRP